LAEEDTSVVTNTLADFRIKPGFRIELVAAEPMVVAPAAMAFDENGRLLVAEQRDYPDRRNASPHLGRVRVLDSSRRDGNYDTAAIYAENLAWPSAIACWDGGVFVATSPDIVYIKAPPEEGKPETRKTALAGFATGQLFSPDRVLNSLTWGLDNRFYGASAGLSGQIFSPASTGNAQVEIRGGDFSFDPRTLAAAPAGGMNQSGLCLDNQGRRYGSDYDHPLKMAMTEPQYRARNPFYPKTPASWDVANPATVVYRAHPADTNLSVVQPGKKTTAARRALPLQPAWLTGARGCVLYRGSAFPPEYMESVFIADPTNHLIHHTYISPNGLTASAVRADDEAGAEFLSSRDPAFQPVQIVNGPEGALYIADFHGGVNRGRIYRIVPAGFKAGPMVKLGAAKPADLVLALAHPDGWRSDTAARLLYEQQDPAAAALLQTTFDNARDPLVRLRALYGLAGQNALSETSLLHGLADGDPRVRQHAIRLLEPLLRSDAFAGIVWNQLELLAGDDFIGVRYQLALSLGECTRPARIRPLTRLLQRDTGDPWMRAAVFSSLTSGAGPIFVNLARTPAFRNNAAGREMLGQLAQFIGVQGRAEEVLPAMNFLIDGDFETELILNLLGGLGDGLRRGRSMLDLVDTKQRLHPIYGSAASGILNNNVLEPVRVAAVNLLRNSGPSITNVEDVLLAPLGSKELQDLQAACLQGLGTMDSPRVATNVIARWSSLSPMLRQVAAASLLLREERIPAVLAALEKGTILTTEIPLIQVNFLRHHINPAIREPALRLFGPLPTQRPEAFNLFRPALQMAGNASHGMRMFTARCAVCHQPAMDGSALGPTLGGVRVQGREKLLRAIVEPNAVSRSGYQTAVLETQTGETHVGLLDDENQTTVSLRRPGAQATVWPRLNVRSLRPQPWSLMPDDLAQDFTVQDMADLLDYLMTGTE
jgi:putative membrane-bound dehydrogenase-like protein